jgi:putative tricarboxylic transport membrane protein
MMRGIFMAPDVKPEEVAYFVELFKRVKETPEWKEFMEKGAFNQTFMTGVEYQKWVEAAEGAHKQLMKEAGFLAN